MKFWRILIVLLVLVALGLMAAKAIFDWSPLRAVHPGIVAFQSRPDVNRFHLPLAYSALGALFTLFVSGVMVLYLLPNQIGRTAKAFSGSWAGTLRLALLGLLSALLVGAAGISSTLAMGTIPLTLFLGMVLFLSSMFGFFALAYQVGRTLLGRAGWSLSPISSLFLGELILFPLVYLPVAGIAVIIILTSLGLGATIATRFGSGRPWSLISLNEEGNE